MAAAEEKDREINSALTAEREALAAGKVLGDGLNPSHPCLGKNRIVNHEQGTVEMLMPDGVTPRKKFALVGFAGSTRGMAPLNDPEWAIVGLNQLYRHLTHPGPDGKDITRHPDLWFEIHKDWNTAVVPGTDYAGWLKSCGVPVYMAYRVPELPTSLGFPLQRMIAKADDYFTSTIAYMVAWATDHIDRLVDERLRNAPAPANAADALALARSLYAEYQIGLFGIDLIVGSEYFEQKPCAEFWIGQAHARGIGMVVPPQSALLKQAYRYGYEMEPQQGALRMSVLEKRKAELIRQHENHSAACLEIGGMIKENAYMAEFLELKARGAAVEL